MQRRSSLEQMHMQQLTEHMCRLGPRAWSEFLYDLSDRVGGLPACFSLLTEYQRRLTPELMRATGGDRFPRRPLHVVPQ